MPIRGRPRAAGLPPSAAPAPACSPQTAARHLVTDPSGRVTGVECLSLRDAPAAARLAHRVLHRWSLKPYLYVTKLGRVLHRPVTWLERRYARPLRVAAARGVILAAGGFAASRPMMRAHAPNARGGLPLATPGDDGSGIRLGTQAGGAAASLDRVLSRDAAAVGRHRRRLTPQNRYATQNVTGGAAVEPFDATKPNIARVWDYWLGGKDNFAADRELAEKMLAVHPPTAQMARENRRFLGRAVSYVANSGIRQFIDVGAGLPTAVNTHDIARHVDPDARVAYVDNDPIVISHARSLLAKSPGVIAVPGDMRDPGRILADPGLTDLIDLASPVCVILSGVLHFAQAATARDVAAAFARAIVPGSYLIISVGSGNSAEGANFTSEYTAARIYIHSLDEIQSFFDGLDLVPPGVVPVRLWTGDTSAPDQKAPTATFLAGLARKPSYRNGTREC